MLDDVALQSRLDNFASTFKNPFIVVISNSIHWKSIITVQSRSHIPCFLASSITHACDLMVVILLCVNARRLIGRWKLPLSLNPSENRRYELFHRHSFYLSDVRRSNSFAKMYFHIELCNSVSWPIALQIKMWWAATSEHSPLDEIAA